MSLEMGRCDNYNGALSRWPSREGDGSRLVTEHKGNVDMNIYIYPGDIRAQSSFTKQPPWQHWWRKCEHFLRCNWMEYILRDDEKKGWEYIYISDEAMWKRERTIFTMGEERGERGDANSHFGSIACLPLSVLVCTYSIMQIVWRGSLIQWNDWVYCGAGEA